MKQRDEYLDSYRRAQADFQNFKRRNATARSDGYEDGVRETLTAMLPAIEELQTEGGEILFMNTPVLKLSSSELREKAKLIALP